MVFLTPDPRGVPFLARHRWIRDRAQEERIVVLNIARAGKPYLTDEERVTVERFSLRLIRVIAASDTWRLPASTPSFDRAAHSAWTSTATTRRSSTPIRRSRRMRTAWRPGAATYLPRYNSTRDPYPTISIFRPSAASSSGLPSTFDRTGRKVRPIGGWRPTQARRTIAVMLWMFVLVAIAPLVSLCAERQAARVRIDAKR